MHVTMELDSMLANTAYTMLVIGIAVSQDYVVLLATDHSVAQSPSSHYILQPSSSLYGSGYCHHHEDVVH